MSTLVVAGKGGAGKTTTAAAVAYELANIGGRRVLLVDMDPMASLTIGLGQQPVDRVLAARPIRIFASPEDDAEVWLARGGARLHAAAAGDIASWLRDGAGFDTRVIDTPPHGVAELVVVPASVADVLLVPTRASVAELPAISDAMGLAATLPSTPRARVLLTCIHPRRRITQRVREFLETTWPGALLSTCVPEDARATEWAEHQVPVTISAPRSRAAQAYRTASWEIDSILHNANQ